MCVFHCGSFQVKYKYTVKLLNSPIPTDSNSEIATCTQCCFECGSTLGQLYYLWMAHKKHSRIIDIEGVLDRDEK